MESHDGSLARLRVLYKEEIAEFRLDFDATDIDKDGKIGGAELKPMLQLQLEREPTDDEVAAMLKEFDINEDGFISFDEYMNCMCGEGWTQDEPPARTSAIKWMVPVDGSNIAVKAFHTAARLMKKGDGWADEIIVYHVTNPGRYQDMAPMYHPDTIKGHFETEAIKADINMGHTFTWVCEEKKDASNQKIREMIRDYADLHADIVVLGSFGSKSTEKVEADAEFSCIGSTTALVTTACKATSIVVNTRSSELPIKNQRRFLIAIDGSDLSHQAFLEVLDMLRPGDYLMLVYIETSSNKAGAAIMAKYEAELLKLKVKGVSKLIKDPSIENGAAIAQKLVEIAESYDESAELGTADVIVIGSNGLSHTVPERSDSAYAEYVANARNAHRKGSVAEKILEIARTSVMTLTVDSVMHPTYEARNRVTFQAFMDS